MEQHLTTHVPIMTTPDFEAYLVDGGINILAGILILIIGWWLSRRLSGWTRSPLDRVHHFDETLKPLIASLVRYAVLVAAVIAVLERFGVETTSLITLLGAAGLAIGLALQGTLSNVASGVMLLVLRPFKVGDWITVSTVNQSGSVREIGLFTTIIISADQSYVSLPNSAIFSSPIVNASREPLSRLNFTIGVDASSDIDAALKIIGDALNTHPRILKVPPPATGVVSLKEYAIELLVRCWVHNADGESVTFDLQKSIRERFRRAGIAIPARRQIAASTAQTVSANEDSPQKSAIRKSG
ncbi:MAG TPA: mechanosensitive ion channel family protein [Rhizomicrobium sp.]|nr:mechanosensitive ion channel family protein [Rhizomicrobium sp.]